MSRWYEKDMYALVRRMDDTVERTALEYYEDQGTVVAMFPECTDWSNVRSVDFAPAMGYAKVGDEGYYVIPHGEDGLGDSILCRFHTRSDAEMTTDRFIMPMWGCVRQDESFTAIVASMTYEYQLVTAVKNGQYSCFARFVLEGKAPCEPITIEYKLLDSNAEYSDVAIAYREWREQRGEIHRYAYRMQGRPAAQYTADSVYVRIRQGWKPVPPLVREQTPENEPLMHVATTFDDVSALLDQFKVKGVDKAEICLVGWNKSGHDGRWPQIFPVEKNLGGEEALRRLTAKAKDMGYAMTCHTNSTDAYAVSDIWKQTDLIMDEHGNPAKNETAWSGGDMYQICPLCSLKQARELLPKVKEMGFSGTHYIDVITTIFPRACHDPKHPVTRRECAGLWNRIMRLARQEFGGISSEGTFDFAALELDYGLYVSFGYKGSPLADECVPLWQLAYHGYVLSNPYTKTVNPTESDLLKVAEYGGRPTFYYNSKFVTPEPGKEVNWMGEDDFHCYTDEDRASSAAYIARVYRWYETVRYLQLIPMKRHEILPNGMRRVTYDNGDVITVDYEAKQAFLNNRKILPMT